MKISAVHKDVVDVEEDAGAGAFGDLGDEVRLREPVGVLRGVIAHVLERDRAPKRVGRFVDPLCDELRGLLIEGNRQKIVKKNAMRTAKAEMIAMRGDLEIVEESAEIAKVFILIR